MTLHLSHCLSSGRQDWNSGRRRRAAVTAATSADLCHLRHPPPSPSPPNWLVASKQDEMTLPHAAGGMWTSRRCGVPSSSSTVTPAPPTPPSSPLPLLLCCQQLRNSSTCENPFRDPEFSFSRVKRLQSYMVCLSRSGVGCARTSDGLKHEPLMSR